MKAKLIDRVTPVDESYHECARYRESIKTVYCKRCAKKEYNNKRKLAALLVE